MCDEKATAVWQMAGNGHIAPMATYWRHGSRVELDWAEIRAETVVRTAWKTSQRVVGRVEKEEEGKKGTGSTLTCS